MFTDDDKNDDDEIVSNGVQCAAIKFSSKVKSHQN